MLTGNFSKEEATSRIAEINERIKDLRSYLKLSGRISGGTFRIISSRMKKALDEKKRLRTYLSGLF